MASTSRLLSTSPGTTAGPELPPARIAARESSRRPPFCLEGPWQPWHRAASTGRIDLSKNSTADGSADGEGEGDGDRVSSSAVTDAGNEPATASVRRPMMEATA